MKKAILGALLIIAIVFAGAFVYQKRLAFREAIDRFQEPPLPPAEPSPFPEPAATTTVQEVRTDDASSTPPLPAVISLPRQKLLDVPFTPQAPTANWDALHEEACEEASIIMAAGYYAHESGVIGPAAAEERIQALVDLQMGLYGFFESTSATATARLIEEYYPNLAAEVLPVHSADAIKKAIAEGYPVLVPADGKALPNPHFRNGGPVYHMLVVRGYTEDRFVTNDPGTRFGEKYLYTYDELLSSIHDWNNGDVPNGDSLMIVVRPRS